MQTQTQEQPIQLFQQRQALATTGATEAVAVARATQEVQAAMVIAKRFPRDETAAFSRVMQACKRKSLAEGACYAYPRGGQTVTGPSIRLAETLAQNWGNIDFGVVELDQRNGESQVMAYAWDLETNTRQTKIFTVKHERRKGKENVPLDDPRDIYEMVANQGARRLRACILGVVPGDVVDAAVSECEKTMQTGANEPLGDRVRKMVATFAEMGITQGMIEAKLGHNLDATSETELVTLRKIFQSLRDGMSKRDDWFKPEASKPDFSQNEPPKDDDDIDRGPRKTAARPAPQQQQQESKPEQSRPEPSKAVAEPERQVKAIKNLLKLSGCSEVELMDLLHAQGLDDSVGTLDEMSNVAAQTLARVHDGWPKYLAALKQAKAATK